MVETAAHRLEEDLGERVELPERHSIGARAGRHHHAEHGVGGVHRALPTRSLIKHTYIWMGGGGALRQLFPSLVPMPTRARR
jgi:hypothetical protein